jgi:transcriptional regulator with XRE-family HTH domain
MTDRARDAASQPQGTALARWLDSVVPALFPSDAALSRALGVPQAYVSRWRRGTTPEVPSLVKLANATGTSIETLLRIAGYRPPADAGKDAGS